MSQFLILSENNVSVGPVYDSAEDAWNRATEWNEKYTPRQFRVVELVNVPKPEPKEYVVVFRTTPDDEWTVSDSRLMTMAVALKVAASRSASNNWEYKVARVVG